MQKGAFHISVNARSLIQSSEAHTPRALEMENSVMHRSDCMKRSPHCQATCQGGFLFLKVAMHHLVNRKIQSFSNLPAERNAKKKKSMQHKLRAISMSSLYGMLLQSHIINITAEAWSPTLVSGFYDSAH